MSTHLIQASNDAEDSIRWERLILVRRLCRAYLREPEGIISNDGSTISLVFTPDLTAPQEATLRRIIRLSGVMRITPAEWAGIEPDLATGVTYLATPLPVSLDTVEAVKAMWRVLHVLLKD